MPKIFPFKPLLPSSNNVAQNIVSLPYDVFSHEGAKQQISLQPQSILSVTRSDVFFDEKDSHESKVYLKAKENLEDFINRGLLCRENKNNLYIYSQTLRGRTQTGLVCLSSLEDYENNIIKKHEKTRPDKEKDRTDHMRVLNAQTGNVFLVYRQHAQIEDIISKNKKEHQEMFALQYGDVFHQVWKIDSEKDINNICELFDSQISATYIADGHHRAASAYRLFRENKSRNQFLTTIFSDKEIEILPYNRVVVNVKNLSSQQVLSEVESRGYIIHQQAPEQNQLSFYFNTNWYSLKRKDMNGLYTDLDKLEASFLQEEILKPIFNVNDPRKDQHIAFVGGIYGFKKLEELVNGGSYDIAFALSPLTINQLISVADAGETMPPKSTWFEPKLLDGFFTAKF